MGQELSCSACCALKTGEFVQTPKAESRQNSRLEEVLSLAPWPATPASNKALRSSPASPAPVVQAPEVRETLPSTFELELHSAHLERSFATFGWMDPYAIITVDAEEVGRTKPDKWAHKDPKWESSYSWKSTGVPGSISVAIWDKNRFHKDVLCGSVTVPCDMDMGRLERRDFTLSKRQKPTGVVSLTLHVSVDGAARDTAAAEYMAPSREPSLGGMEFDNVATWSQSRERAPSLHLKEAEASTADAVAESDAESNESAKLRGEGKAESPTEAPSSGAPAEPLLGSWKCVATAGLDEFLKATGVGMFQRKIANAARWPGWEYRAQGDRVLFVNHSAIGDLKEEFPLGKEYSWKDGHGNIMTCKAEWQVTPDGGVLLTTRNGSIGSYKEERRVKGDRLEFVLTHASGVSWGRTFEREK